MKFLGFVLAFSFLLAAVAAPLGLGVQAVATGDLVPELSGAWSKGGPVRIAEQKGKKVTVLYFWAVNQPSLEDMPRMGEVAKRFADKPVTFVGIGCDAVNKVAEFFRAKELPMPILIDDKLANLCHFLRPNDRVPLAVIVDREGRLAWRGAASALPPVLEEVLEGKFDLKEHVRREAFAEEVRTALGKNHYEEALKLIDGELKSYPGNVELIAIKANIWTRGLKKPEQAIRAVDDGLKSSPRAAALYKLKVKLLHMTNDYAALAKFYDDVIRVFADEPLLLMSFAEMEIQQPLRENRPELYCKLFKAARASKGLKDDRERGIVELAHARMLFFCGRPELAFSGAKRAVVLLKDSPQYEEARTMAEFYRRAAAMSKQLSD
jgi:peroxiredoxin